MVAIQTSINCTKCVRNRDLGAEFVVRFERHFGKKKARDLTKSGFFKYLAPQAGFEPATNGLTVLSNVIKYMILLI